MAEMTPNSAAPSVPEDTLIAAARGGDLESFNALVLRYQDTVYSAAYRILGEPASAADAAQDAFINAYRRLDSYRGGSFKAWLLRITTNQCYDALRRMKRRPADSIEELPGSDSDDGPPLAADTLTPEQAALNAELRRAIESCISGLKDDFRIVFVMADVEELAYQEIAEALSLRLGTVKSRLSRARQAMRACLDSVRELLPDAYRL